MVSGIVLAALVVVAGTGDRTGRGGALALVALGVTWYFVSKGLEGWVLFRVTRTHGFVSSDLVSVVALALAAWRWRTDSARPLT